MTENRVWAFRGELVRLPAQRFWETRPEDSSAPSAEAERFSYRVEVLEINCKVVLVI